MYLCTDLNPAAAACTSQTGLVNNAPLQPVITDLVSALLPRLTGAVDVLVFNPPYVETEADEMEVAQGAGKIDTTWAGGADGMVVTNRVLKGGIVEVSCLSDFWVQGRGGADLGILRRADAAVAQGGLLPRRRSAEQTR